MKKLIYKILFPFFKTKKHDFLLDSMVFRFLIVLYVVGVLALFVYILQYFGYSLWGWCYDSIDAYSKEAFSNPNYVSNAVNNCSDIRMENIAETWISTVVSILIIHYVFQLILFKIIIDFVVIGSKVNK